MNNQIIISDASQIQNAKLDSLIKPMLGPNTLGGLQGSVMYIHGLVYSPHMAMNKQSYEEMVDYGDNLVSQSTLYSDALFLMRDLMKGVSHSDLMKLRSEGGQYDLADLECVTNTIAAVGEVAAQRRFIMDRPSLNAIKEILHKIDIYCLEQSGVQAKHMRYVNHSYGFTKHTGLEASVMLLTGPLRSADNSPGVKTVAHRFEDRDDEPIQRKMKHENDACTYCHESHGATCYKRVADVATNKLKQASQKKGKSGGHDGDRIKCRKCNAWHKKPACA